MSTKTALDTSEPIAIGPLEENGEQVVYVTFPEGVSEEGVRYTINGETHTVATDDDVLTTKSDRNGLPRRMIEKFEDSQYIKTMEVRTTSSGSINVKGV